ncbi:Ras-related protein Rab-32 [Trichoplax sp. H2]|nr:Ras-related protein Rab-32 [Trichoplax sp. H2]|eukprot:RDD37594.1 Ras-related protein Rab-32 [Trichoplax sp. H2]
MAQKNNPVATKEHSFKFIIVGKNHTGKSSIIRRYVNGLFTDYYKITMGVDFALKVINWDAKTSIKLQLWDVQESYSLALECIGQDFNEKMTHVYFKDAVGAFVVYDVTDVKTFESTKMWKEDIDKKVFLPDGCKIPVVLLANKCDKAKVGNHNSPEYLDNYIQDNGYIKWFETSAKTGINIDKAFRSLVEEVYESSDKSDKKETTDTENIKLNDTSEKDVTKSSCCF